MPVIIEEVETVVEEAPERRTAAEQPVRSRAQELAELERRLGELRARLARVRAY